MNKITSFSLYIFTQLLFFPSFMYAQTDTDVKGANRIASQVLHIQDDARYLTANIFKPGEKGMLYFSNRTTCGSFLNIRSIRLHEAYPIDNFLENTSLEEADVSNEVAASQVGLHGFQLKIKPTVPVPSYFVIQVTFEPQPDDNCYVTALDIPVLILHTSEVTSKTYLYDSKLSACQPIINKEVEIPKSDACDIFPDYVYDIAKGKHILTANETAECFSKIFWNYNANDDEKGSVVEVEFPKIQKYGITVEARLKDKKQEKPVTKKLVVENRENFQFTYKPQENLITVSAKELSFLPTSVSIYSNEGKELISLPINVTQKGFQVDFPVKGIDLKNAWITIDNNGIKMAKPLAKGK
ncbi:MAG: hypothetical protein ACKVTZ_18510 [Bacteroidia bacterium]